MKRYKFTASLLALALPALMLFSCSEDTMDEINRDKNHPTDVEAKFIMADLITATAFSTVGGDLSTYASAYMELETGIHNQLYNAEIRNTEPQSSTTYNNTWGSIYANLQYALIIIDKCSPDGSEPKNQITLGIGQILAAYNLAVLTDLFGDVPWTEACNLNEYMQPKIDTQESIYKAIMKYLDDALVNLNGSDASGLGGKDFIYGGNATAWKKMANGLKARYTMRLINKSADKTGDYNKIIDYVNNSFQSAAEECKFNIYDGSSASNPLFGFTWSRDGLAASQSLMDKFVARNDPRATQAFMDADWTQITDVNDEGFAPNGTPEQLQYYYNTSIACMAETAPTQLLSYHEVLYLKAEAQARLGQKDEAEKTLRMAVAAGFMNLQVAIQATIDSPTLGNYGGIDAEVDLSPEVAAEYFDASVKQLFDANPLKEILVQKYLSFHGASGENVEAYNDYRRQQGGGETFVDLVNPNNATKFPLRYSYGGDDVIANQNVKAAYGDGTYVYSEKVWWAGGTR